MKHTIPRQRLLVAALAAAALLSVSAWASAAPTSSYYTTHFTTLNSSGVTGSASVRLNGSQLTVHINASGLEANETHVQHIHGPSDASGNPTQASTPSLAQDTNGDGVLEVLEGAATYGPILVPLAPFQSAPNGTIDYTHTFDLTDSSIYFNGATESDLFPLNFREIVIHGLTAPTDISNGGLNGTTVFAAGAYDPFIPVASGVLMAAVPVPEPAEFGMMLLGLGLVGGFWWLRRKGSLQHEGT